MAAGPDPLQDRGGWPLLYQEVIASVIDCLVWLSCSCGLQHQLTWWWWMLTSITDFFLLTLFDKCLGLRKGASLSMNLWEEWKTFCFSLDSVRWIATKGNDKADFLVERTMRWDWFIAAKTWQSVWIATTIVVVHKLDWRVKKTVYSSEMLRFTLEVHLFTVMMELHLRLFTLVNI